MKSVLKIVGGISYPFLIYLGLRYFSPRVVGMVCLLIIGCRYRLQSRVLWDGLAWPQKIGVGMLVSVSMGVSIFNSELLLRLLPVAMNGSMLFIFGFTLKYPPSMIERFARLVTPSLPQEAIVYTRYVTVVWCGFFLMNALIAAYTAFFMSRAAWLFYNGGVAYVLMGILFAGEWLYRRWRFPDAL